MYSPQLHFTSSSTELQVLLEIAWELWELITCRRSESKEVHMKFKKRMKIISVYKKKKKSHLYSATLQIVDS